MGFIFAGVLIAYVFILAAAVIAAIECEKGYTALFGWVFVFLWSVLGVGYLFQTGIERNKIGPCVAYETQMHYNTSTKTMMPAKVCVLRGEWIEEG